MELDGRADGERVRGRGGRDGDRSGDRSGDRARHSRRPLERGVVRRRSILAAQGNLANTYQRLGQPESALRLNRDVYTGNLKLNGEEDEATLVAASNYAADLFDLQRFEETKSLLRKTISVARRVLGETNILTIRMRWTCALALREDPAATLDDLREAMTTLEDVTRIARRTFGGAHPDVAGIEQSLQDTRAALRARETPSPGGSA